MSELLLLGANRSHVGSIRALRSRGFVVHAVDDVPIPYGIEAADVGYRVDPADVDGLVRELPTGWRPQVILHSSETLLASAIGLSQHFGLRPPSPSWLGDKALVRARLESDPSTRVLSRRCRTPQQLRGALATWQGPAIVKPSVSGGGSRGVMRLDQPTTADPHALWQSTKAAGGAPGASVLVEEVLVGPQLSIDAWVDDAGVRVWGVGVNIKQRGVHQVNTAIVFSEPIWRRYHLGATEALDSVCRLLGYRWGPIHAEFVATDCGLRLLELAPRVGGGAVPDAIAASGSPHPAVAAAQLSVGGTDPVPRPPRRPSALQFVITEPGRALAADGAATAVDVPGVCDIFVMVPLDGWIGELTQTSGRLGFVVATGATVEEVSESIARALAHITVRYADGRCLRPISTALWPTTLQTEELLDVDVQDVGGFLS
ncbi:MAG: ATP-grasp domain-containing protein [Actinomycetes bacterium]